MNDDGFFLCTLLNSSKGAPKCVLKKIVYMCGYDPSILHDNIYCDNDEETIKHLKHTLYNSCLSKLNPKNYDDFSSLVLVSTARSLNIMIERTKEFIPNHQLQKKKSICKPYWLSMGGFGCHILKKIATKLFHLQPKLWTCCNGWLEWTKFSPSAHIQCFPRAPLTSFLNSLRNFVHLVCMFESILVSLL